MNTEEQDVIIEARDVHYAYEEGGPHSLNGVSLKIKKGRKVAFMGANGCGKSTFFLCCNGIYKPDDCSNELRITSRNGMKTNPPTPKRLGSRNRYAVLISFFLFCEIGIHLLRDCLRRFCGINTSLQIFVRCFLVNIPYDPILIYRLCQ